MTATLVPSFSSIVGPVVGIDVGVFVDDVSVGAFVVGSLLIGLIVSDGLSVVSSLSRYVSLYWFVLRYSPELIL